MVNKLGLLAILDEFDIKNWKTRLEVSKHELHFSRLLKAVLPNWGLRSNNFGIDLFYYVDIAIKALFPVEAGISQS